MKSCHKVTQTEASLIYGKWEGCGKLSKVYFGSKNYLQFSLFSITCRGYDIFEAKKKKKLKPPLMLSLPRQIHQTENSFKKSKDLLPVKTRSRPGY